MEKKLYKVRTTFLGADKYSEFYFDTMEKAQNFLQKQNNGEIVKVIAFGDGLNYSDECTFNELTFGGIYTVKIKEI